MFIKIDQSGEIVAWGDSIPEPRIEVDSVPEDIGAVGYRYVDNEFVRIPPTPPESVTPRQLRLVLVSSGLSLGMIDGMIDSLPEPQRSVARVEWEYALEFKRHHPLVNQFGAALGKTSEEIDAMFLAASKL
jgi:hypothetical protein